jgi:two-component system NtrC family sensor kinase
MPEGGTITITTQQDENSFSVTISDTGPGISQENLDKLFSPFFTTKPVGKGTGLDLPVCYGIIKMHGGNIEAGNNPDGGAFFKITVNHYIQEKEGVKNGKS